MDMDADIIAVTAEEMRRFYGTDASRLAARNILKPGRTDEWRRFWFLVWRAVA